MKDHSVFLTFPVSSSMIFFIAPVHTNASNFDKEEFAEKQQPKPKSWHLKVLDGIREHLAVTILGGVFVVVIVSYHAISSEQGALKERIQSAKDTAEKTEKKTETVSERLSELDKNLSVFRVQVEKDVEYLKEQLYPNSNR